MRGLLRSEDGNTAVEFALLAPVFLAAMMGVIELGRAMWWQNTLDFAVEEATRFAMVNGDASTTQIAAFARSRLPDAQGLEAATVTASVTASEVTVQAQITFTLAAQGLIPIEPIVLSSQSRFPR